MTMSIRLHSRHPRGDTVSEPTILHATFTAQPGTGDRVAALLRDFADAGAADYLQAHYSRLWLAASSSSIATKRTFVC